MEVQKKEKTSLLEEEAGEQSTAQDTRVETEQEQPSSQPIDTVPFSFIILCVNLFQLGFTIVNAVAKALMNDWGMSAPEFAFVRSFFNMCASRALLGYIGVGVWDGVMGKHHLSLFLRCFAGTFVFTGMMYVVKILPLTIFFMIFQTSPFIVALIAWLWLGESMTSLEGCAMVLSYIGIAMISLSQPAVDDQVNSGEVATAVDSQYIFGIVLSLFLAVNFAIVQTATRNLKQIHFAVIQFLYATTSTVVTASMVAYASYSTGTVPYVFQSSTVYVMLFSAAACSFGSQSLMTYSSQNANPATVALLQYCGVIYNFAADVFVFGQEFTQQQLAGVGLILFFNVLAGVQKIQLQRDQLSKDRYVTAPSQQNNSR